MHECNTTGTYGGLQDRLDANADANANHSLFRNKGLPLDSTISTHADREFLLRRAFIQWQSTQREKTHAYTGGEEGTSSTAAQRVQAMGGLRGEYCR